MFNFHVPSWILVMSSFEVDVFMLSSKNARVYDIHVGGSFRSVLIFL